jgi:hypothetical protein
VLSKEFSYISQVRASPDDALFASHRVEDVPATWRGGFEPFILYGIEGYSLFAIYLDNMKVIALPD